MAVKRVSGEELGRTIARRRDRQIDQRQQQDGLSDAEETEKDNNDCIKKIEQRRAKAFGDLIYISASMYSCRLKLDYDTRV